ncbi:MAG: hypothetical protein B7Z51_05765 [Methyloversatilis sp. 12-65-5]|jgi:hypothetical protein|nr:hypothetical protein [Gammaproteobacteria bacterium]OYW31042.1 MAG: hypothetical protein B7Z51_05765 [Methyloversatilis sp. 12-65-5]
MGELMPRTSMMMISGVGFFTTDRRVFRIPICCHSLVLVAKDVTKLGLTRDHFPAKVRTEQRDHQDSDKKSGKEGTNLLHLFFIPQMGSSFARRHI